MDCACGHPIALHGRRGYGSCRHGSASPIAVAVEAARICVMRGMSKEATHETVQRAFKEAPAPCECKRFRKAVRNEL